MVNQTLMAGPLWILYELGIIAARIFDRKQPKPAAAPAARAGAAFAPERDVMRGSLRGYVVRKPFHREGWAVLAVVVGEDRWDEPAAKMALGTAMQGNVRTMTMRVFGREGMDKIIGSLP